MDEPTLPALRDAWDTMDDVERRKAKRAIRMLRDDFADACVAAPRRWERLARFYTVLDTMLERMEARS